MTPKDLRRFWSKVKKSSGCWNWAANRKLDGYGRFWFLGKARRAHRVSYQISVAPIPRWLHVLHKCDNRACVNPKHLWLGTNADNMGDMKKKGRVARGEKQRLAKLTNTKVIAMRADKRMLREIAEEYRVCESNVSRIKNRVYWRHV